MNRTTIEWRNVLRTNLNTGTSERITKIIFKDGKFEGEWFEKSKKNPYFYNGGDMREKFAEEIAKVIGTNNVEVQLGIDEICDFPQRVSFTKSFLEKGEEYIEAHKFFPQYATLRNQEDLSEMESTRLYNIVDAKNNQRSYRYLISDNIEDLKFYDSEIRIYLENEKVKSGCTGNVNAMMKELYHIWFQDFLLGNKDRSAKNWGIIRNSEKRAIRLAPSFDNTELFSKKYIHLHGLNVTPECMIEYLLKYQMDNIKDCIIGASELKKGKLDEILSKFDEKWFDSEEAKEFVEERIELLRNMNKKITEKNETIPKCKKGEEK